MSAARQPVACVMGDTDLLEPLGRAGVPCVVVTGPGGPSRYSRFTRQVLDWADPWEEPDRLVNTLLRFAATQPEPPVLFYEEDRAVLLISRYRDRLAQGFRFVIPDATLVEDLVDKSRFQALAARLDLPVPAARRLRPVDEPVPEQLDIPFPLILKPLTRVPVKWEPAAGFAKARKVESLEDLRELWPRLSAAGLEVMVQELIEGPETRVESYHVYVDERGETVGEFTGRKIRTWPREFGHSTALEITDVADVAALGRELVQRLGLRGVAKFDFKRAHDGRLYLFEINPRFTLWNHPGALAGVNLPLLVYGDLTGAPRNAVTRARPGVRWCKVWSDRSAARAWGVPFRQWLPWALRCEAKRSMAWDDPLPLLCGGIYRLLFDNRY